MNRIRNLQRLCALDGWPKLAACFTWRTEFMSLDLRLLVHLGTIFVQFPTHVYTKSQA